MSERDEAVNRRAGPQGLIKQTPREKLFGELAKLGEETRRAEMKRATTRELEDLETDFVKVLTILAYRHFKIRPAQLKQFDEQKMRELVAVLAERARRTKRFQMASVPLFLAVPVLGWLVLGTLFEVPRYPRYNEVSHMAFNSWLYLNRYRKLQKVHGEAYTPYVFTQDPARFPFQVASC